MSQAIFQALKLDLEHNWQSSWVILTGADSNSDSLQPHGPH